MKSLSDIKTEKQNKVNALITDSSVFFAFSNEQFAANKTPLKEGEKYVSIGAGGYMPKGNVEAFTKGMQDIETWYKTEIRSSKKRKENILYELCNHEAFYTGEIEDTLLSLGSDYTESEVMEVFRANRKKQSA